MAISRRVCFARACRADLNPNVYDWSVFSRTILPVRELISGTQQVLPFPMVFL